MNRDKDRVHASRIAKSIQCDINHCRGDKQKVTTDFDLAFDKSKSILRYHKDAADDFKQLLDYP